MLALGDRRHLLDDLQRRRQIGRFRRFSRFHSSLSRQTYGTNDVGVGKALQRPIVTHGLPFVNTAGDRRLLFGVRNKLRSASLVENRVDNVRIAGGQRSAECRRHRDRGRLVRDNLTDVDARTFDSRPISSPAKRLTQYITALIPKRRRCIAMTLHWHIVLALRRTAASQAALRHDLLEVMPPLGEDKGSPTVSRSRVSGRFRTVCRFLRRGELSFATRMRYNHIFVIFFSFFSMCQG